MRLRLQGVVTDQKKRADAEINPLQTEMKELKEIKKCVLKVLPDTLANYGDLLEKKNKGCIR